VIAGLTAVQNPDFVIEFSMMKLESGENDVKEVLATEGQDFRAFVNRD
jgi:hypothetical protein